MKLNPLVAFPIAAGVIGVVILWNSFHHKVSDLAVVDAQPSGKYFLLLKETGPGQHDSAIVLKEAERKQAVISGVAKGDINSPVLNQRLITFTPSDKSCFGTTVLLQQTANEVLVFEMSATDPGCTLGQAISNGTVLKKL
jgi:hypothetical protein